MNQRSDIDRVLHVWMADGPTSIPDRVVDVVATRIALQPRRLRSRRLPWRPIPMNRLTYAAAAVAVILVAIVGYNLLPRQASFGGPSPTPGAPVIPTPTANASPTAAGSPESFQCEEGTGCAGLLAGGSHTTSQFVPALTYTTPADWMNPIDLPTLVGITPVEQGADLILVWSSVAPAETSASCAVTAKAGAGTSADDWITFLTEHPGLRATNVRSMTIGGRKARSVDVSSFGGYSSPCVADRSDFNVPIVKTPDGATGDGYGVRIGAEARIYAIEVGSETVIVTLYGYQGISELVDAAALGDPVVASFVFGAP